MKAAKKTLAASTEEWDELVLSLVFSTGVFPAMNEIEAYGYTKAKLLEELLLLYESKSFC